MARDCENLTTCSFFAKYGDSHAMACKGFVSKYCRGPLMMACKRREYRAVHGKPAPEDMLPSGLMIPTTS